MKIAKLIPKDGQKFHFGVFDLRKTESIFHSDSLFSTIVNNYMLLYGGDELERFINGFPLVSSMFHMVNMNGKETYFLPKPPLDMLATNDLQYIKAWKKIEFVSERVLKRWNEEGMVNFSKDYVVDEKYLFDSRDLEEANLSNLPSEFKVMKKVRETKVAIPRDMGDASPFYVDNFELPQTRNNELIAKPCFYFLFKENPDVSEGNVFDEKLWKRFYAAVRLISDEGIGGERSSGKGLFEKIEFSEMEESSQGGCYMSISLVLPNNAEEAKKGYKYDLLERKGYVYSRGAHIVYRKRPFRMFKEGSVFNAPIAGQKVSAVDKNNFKEHDVYRWGKAFTLAVRGD